MRLVLNCLSEEGLVKEKLALPVIPPGGFWSVF